MCSSCGPFGTSFTRKQEAGVSLFMCYRTMTTQGRCPILPAQALLPQRLPAGLVELDSMFVEEPTFVGWVTTVRISCPLGDKCCGLLAGTQQGPLDSGRWC